MVIKHQKPALQPVSINLDKYDLVVLGTPVWAGSPAPPLEVFLEQNPVSGKKVALFCCHGGGKGKVFAKLKALLPGNTFAGELDFVNPSKADRQEVGRKLGEWVKTLA